MTTPSHTELAAQLDVLLHKFADACQFGIDSDERAASKAIRDFFRAALESPERVQGEVVAYTVAGQVRDWSRDFSMYKTQHYVRPVYATPPTAPAQDVHAQRNAQTLVDIGNAALRAGWNGVDMKAFVLARLATPSPQAEKQPLSDEWIRSMCKQGWVFDTVKQWVRVTEAAHGIVTKEST